MDYYLLHISSGELVVITNAGFYLESKATDESIILSSNEPPLILESDILHATQQYSDFSYRFPISFSIERPIKELDVSDLSNACQALVHYDWLTYLRDVNSTRYKPFIFWILRQLKTDIYTKDSDLIDKNKELSYDEFMLIPQHR